MTHCIRRRDGPSTLVAVQRVVVLLLLLAYGCIGVPNFLSTENLSAILYQYSIIGLLALGQFLVVLTAGIDLSQGSLVALTSITTALDPLPLRHRRGDRRRGDVGRRRSAWRAGSWSPGPRCLHSS